jgi:hypothetical protein
MQTREQLSNPQRRSAIEKIDVVTEQRSLDVVTEQRSLNMRKSSAWKFKEKNRETSQAALARWWSNRKSR